MVGQPLAKAVFWPAGWSRPDVRFVTVNMYDTVFNRTGWDCHGASPFSTL